jgi:hypothetical protein
VCVESIFDCPPEAAWREVQTPRLLLEIIRPLLGFRAARGFHLPNPWRQGITVVGQNRVLGILPLGRHWLYFERIDAANRQIQTRECNRWIARWDHLISVEQAPDGRTHYRDDLEIRAGLLTPLVWLFAQWFYRHRQRRWRRVAQRLNTRR